MTDPNKAVDNKEKRLTRQQRKELGRRLATANPGLEVVHRDAAAVDVGSRTHYVAVRPDRDVQPVRNFGCFTAALHEIARNGRLAQAM